LRWRANLGLEFGDFAGWTLSQTLSQTGAPPWPSGMILTVAGYFTRWLRLAARAGKRQDLPHEPLTYVFHFK
jgi:hypothetical protein